MCYFNGFNLFIEYTPSSINQYKSIQKYKNTSKNYKLKSHSRLFKRRPNTALTESVETFAADIGTDTGGVRQGVGELLRKKAL